jgi:hypothetical protein
VNPELNYALMRAIQGGEARDARGGDRRRALTEAGEESLRWEEELTGGPKLSATGRKRKKGKREVLGRQLGSVGWAG